MDMPKRDKCSVSGISVSGIVFVGFFFLGFSIAYLLGRAEVAPFLAMALGFISMAVVKLKIEPNA